jgi:hypothetical protein
MNEYLKLIRDSPFLLKRSFLYNQEIDQMKSKEKEMLYDMALQEVRKLFGDPSDELIADEDQELADDKDQQSDDFYSNPFSPLKDFNDPICDDLLSVSSDSRNISRANNDNMECDDNNSLRDYPNNNFNISQSENRSYLSHSSYMEDIEPELKDFTPKNVFKTPRKKQRLSGYDQNSLNIPKFNDIESIKVDSVSH